MSTGIGRELDPLLEYEPDDYTPPVYTATRQVKGMHDWPRFGRTTEFVSALEEDQRSQYITGIAVGSIITLAVFIVWALVLIGLKCAGKRVGCASGKPRKPEEPNIAGSINEETYQRNMSRWTKANQGYERRLLVNRIIFLLSGIGVIVSSILFFTMGVGSLANSLNDAQGSITETQDILISLHNATGTFINMSYTAEESRDEFIGLTDSVCGNVVNAAAETALEQEAQQMIDDVVETLSEADDFLRDASSDLQNDLSVAIQYAEDANNTVSKAYPFLYCTAAVMGILIIIVICLMIEVVLAWRGRKMRNCFVSCMKNGVILPIFFLFIILSWLFASLFQLAAIGSADFCVQPEQHVDYVLNKYVAKNMSPVLFAYLTYYLRCQSEFAPVELISEAEPLWNGIDVVHDFLEYIADNGVSITSVCGSGNLNAIQDLASALHSTLHVVNGLFVVALNLLQCSTFNPIYTGVLHDSLCVNGASGLVWLFSTLLCMAIFSMLMVTVRSARSEGEGGAEYVEDIDGGYEPYDPKKSFANEEQHDLALEEQPPIIEPDT